MLLSDLADLFVLLDKQEVDLGEQLGEFRHGAQRGELEQVNLWQPERLSNGEREAPVSQTPSS